MVEYKQRLIAGIGYEQRRAELGRYSVDTDCTYGLNGRVAPWVSSTGAVYLNGGAPQFTFSLNIDIMLRLGIVLKY